MTTHVTGQAAAGTAAPNTLHLATFRRNLLAVVVGNPLFTDAEQLRTNHNAHECQDAKKLSLWLKNVRRVAAERERAADLALMAQGIAQFEAKLAARAVARAATAPATAAQVEEITKLAQHPTLTKSEAAQALAALPLLTRQGAVRLIGRLWYKVLYRTGRGEQYTDGSTSYAA